MQQNKNYVEYKSFDELPDELKEKFKSGVKGQLLDKAKYGYLDFINQLIEREDELIGDYVGNSVKTKIKFGECGHVGDISSSNYKAGRGCGVCKGRQVQQDVNDLATTHPNLVKEWHPIKNGRLTPHEVTHGSHKKVWWKCEHGHEWEASANKRSNGRKCPYCSNQKVLKGYNDIATSHPQYVKYFANIEDAHTHTYSSGKKVELKCPDCSHTKMMAMHQLTNQGFSCDLCSDGISFPEKLVGSILTRLDIEFIKQMSYDNGEHRYDFFLPKYSVILETHGIQHYEQSPRGRSLLEEQENDRFKRKLAIDHGILNENYHEVDCRYSKLEWCRPNIEKALSNYVDMSVLTDEDWKEIDIQTQKSLRIEVCNYWNEHKEVDNNVSTKKVAVVFDIGISTVRDYLKWGNANGFCTYDAQEERETSNRRSSVFVYLIRPNGSKWFDKPMSMNEMERQTEISQLTIKRNLDKGALKYSNSAKYDPKYIGSYIVSAEVYDSQNQAS